MQDSNRPGVSAEDDPIFDADHSRCPSGTERRARTTVDAVERHTELWRAAAAENSTRPRFT
ncbi:MULTISPECIES: hypothetical protein [Streptomyces]|uniref:Uncharacterized protein n=1 Tax=Streptomyces glycanivorans TaxID=3033808 RepID=A0ABY9JR54_9ACTN|nr:MULTISPECIES: hypothetical protein [unclassified Streptomyces]WLQ69191.1 hypothetical protein P8A20_37245 [Streptomyces sp. Alt3]WSR53533.1 hypothetical protein OG279_38910 [Streptomyces sp. NBC_01201]